MTRDPHWIAITPAGLIARRAVWACIGAAVVAPGVWLWASWVAGQDARRLAHADRAALVAQCADEQAVAVEVLNSGTVFCASGSGRRMHAPLAHPLRGR
jgi:hypothetical protein